VVVAVVVVTAAAAVVVVFTAVAVAVAFTVASQAVALTAASQAVAFTAASRVEDSAAVDFMTAGFTTDFTGMYSWGSVLDPIMTGTIPTTTTMTAAMSFAVA
jgi:hypothetical protein